MRFHTSVFFPYVMLNLDTIYALKTLFFNIFQGKIPILSKQHYFL